MVGLSTKGRRAQAGILDAAEGVFAGSGLLGASVRDVARVAGVPTASLLHHFPRKERLYDAVLSRIAAEVDGVISGALAGRAAVRTKLRRLVGRFWEWAQAQPRRSNLLLRELLDNPQRIGRAGRLHLAPVVARMTRFVELGRGQGVFRGVDPVVFVAQLAGAVSYFIAARPTLSRVVGRSEAALSRRFARELQAMAAGTLLARET